jgi:2-polyprenyl-6-methoxyphenol hydroxylase-like FAD-dependent oxidoreductase
MSHYSKIITDTERQRVDGSSSHAIVIGGGIAGLLAARVLADHFDLVTIIERDRFPEKPEPRQGTPQSYHPHVLLVQGQLILERLFPRLKDELVRNGASSVDWTADFRWLLMGGWAPRFPSGITSRACTRNLLEAIIRQHLVNDRPVELLEASQVTGLLANTGNTAVTGVRVRDGNGKEAEIPAQLVVDASGRGSKAPKWLQSLGYGMPQETTIKSFLGYATRWYQTLGGSPLDYKVLYLMPKAPDHPRGGVIHQVEDGRWLVNLIGVGRDYPPADEAGFLNFARSMHTPEIYEAIRDAQPLSPIYGYQRTENRWRHYERLSRLPENFVVLGDAVCAFNPVYGQGITVAALGVLTLDQCLRQQNQRRSNRALTGLAQRFQKQLAKVNTVPWLMATGDDFRWPTTEGGQPDSMTRLMHWYLDRVMLVASESAEVYKVLVEVLHLLKPPTALFQPGILAQVMIPSSGLKRYPEMREKSQRAQTFGLWTKFASRQLPKL